MWHLLSCSLVSIKEAHTSLSRLIWLAKYDTFFHYHVDILMSVLLKSKASSVLSYAVLGGLSWSQDWMGKEPSEYSPASTQILDGESGQGATSRRWDDHLTTDWKSNEISGPRTARNPLIYHHFPIWCVAILGGQSTISGQTMSNLYIYIYIHIYTHIHTYIYISPWFIGCILFKIECLNISNPDFRS